MRIRSGFLAVCAFGWSACTTTPVDPIQPPAPAVPGWAAVPHPVGFDLGDIEAIFLATPPSPSEAGAAGAASRPLTRQEVASCDRPFRVLKEKTLSKTELILGIRELVRTDPVTQHWCFYGKILVLEQKLKEPDRLLKGRQEVVLETFAYLTPVARAFHDELNDSRYWRWAIQRYRLASERVFFQRVEPSAETTSALVTAVDPFAWVRPGQGPEGGILQKYGLVPPAPSAVLPPTAQLDTVTPPEVKAADTDLSQEAPEQSVQENTFPAIEEEELE